MKKSIINLLLIFPLITFAQSEVQVFNYLHKDVKTVNLSKKEKKDYEYKKGLIIEKDNFPLVSSMNIEKHFHYSKIGVLDSIVYFEGYEDTIYIDKTIYNYNKNNRLISIDYGGNLEKEIIRIDSFVYNSDGQVDTIFWLSNRTEGIFGTNRIDTIKLYAIFAFKYDENFNLIEMTSNQPFGAKETNYFYNDNGILIQKIEHFGFTRHGCIVGEDKIYSVTNFKRNEKELIEQEIIQYYLLKPNGRKKKNGKIRFKKRYEYY